MLVYSVIMLFTRKAQLISLSLAYFLLNMLLHRVLAAANEDVHGIRKMYIDTTLGITAVHPNHHRLLKTQAI